MQKPFFYTFSSLLIICCVLFALSGFSFTNAKLQANGNLLQNGDFEGAAVGLGVTSIPGWRVVSGNVDVIPNSERVLWAWHQSADGTKSLELIGNPGAAIIEQSFPTEVGRNYVFSGWIAHHFAVGEAGVNVSANGEALEPLYHSGQATQADMKWARFTREFTARSTTTTLRLGDRNLAGWEWGGAVVDGLAVSLVPRPQPPTELLQNGNFEAGAVGLGVTSIPGWQVTRGNVDVIPNNVNVLWAWHQSADGTKSLELTGNPGAATIRQSFPTEVGRKYTFSGWVSHHFAIREAGINASVNGVPLEPLYHNTTNSQADMKWMRFTREFVARSTTTTLELSDRSLVDWPWGGAVVDGLSVTAAAGTTPTPTPTATPTPTPTVSLPPDPGEEGKRTLEGIDSDKDGLRDDVQRWIYFRFPNSEKARAAFRQTAIDFQTALLAYNDKERAVQAFHSYGRSVDCLVYVIGGDSIEDLQQAFAIKTDLKLLFINTPQRSDAYLVANSHFSGQIFRGLPEGEERNACRFNLEAMPN